MFRKMQQHSHTQIRHQVLSVGVMVGHSRTLRINTYDVCFRYFDFLIKFMGDSVCHICEINLCAHSFISFYFVSLGCFYSTERNGQGESATLCISFVWFDFLANQTQAFAYNLVLEFLIACNSSDDDDDKNTTNHHQRQRWWQWRWCYFRSLPPLCACVQTFHKCIMYVVP